MFNRWQRIGNYFDNQQYIAFTDDINNLHIVNRHVSFVTNAIKPVITRIDVHSYIQGFIDSEPCIRLIFSPFYYSELLSYCKRENISCRSDVLSYSKWNTGQKLEANAYSTKPVILDTKYFFKLKRLFEYFNAYIQPQPFSREIMDEIQNIYYSGSKNIFTHIVTEMPSYILNDTKNNHTNRRTDYEGLADLLHTGHANPVLYKKYLLEGDNPEERSVCGTRSAMTFAILEQESLVPLELLLWYEANPFRRLYNEMNYYNGTDGRFSIAEIPSLFCRNGLFELLSPIEKALLFNQIDKANVIGNEFSHLINSSLSNNSNRKRMQVITSQVQYDDDMVVSHFIFDDYRHIKTRLKYVEQMTREEKQKILDLVKNNFMAIDDLDQRKLTDIFNKDFSANKLIDVIYDNDKVIGFILFELIIPKGSSKSIILHCAYSAIDPEYRGYGLMLFLSFRLAYILQAMLPEKQIGVFYCAAHYNSYRMANFKHSPKYQSPEVQKIISDTLKVIYDTEILPYYHHYLKSYIEDNVSVKSVSHTSQVSLNERIYNREILGHEDIPNGEFRSAPVMFFVGDENYKYIANTASRLGINFDIHIAEFACELKKLLPFLSVDNFSFKVLMKSSNAFFKMHGNALEKQGNMSTNLFKSKL